MIFSEDKKIRTFYFALTLFSLLFFSVRVYTNKEKLFVIDGDGRGYYSYLPALFLQNDLSWSKLEEYCPKERQTFLNDVNNKKLNKYSFGTSLLMLPFFLIAYFLSIVLGLNGDGNNFLFHFFISTAALFYFLAGIYFSIRSLLLFSKNTNVVISAVSAVILGTSILFYTFFECSLSHVYSFCCISGFGFFTIKFLSKNSKKLLLIAALFLFLILVIRPFNVIVIASFPFLFLHSHQSRVDFYKMKMVGIYSLFSILIATACLLLFNYLQCGTLIFKTYTNEGFNFLNPEFFNFLFSARKGLFFYSPILFIAFTTTIVFAIKKQMKFVFLFLFFIVLFYFLSAWWNWFYGDSFGQRVVVDYYFFFLFPLAYFFEFVFSSLSKQIILGVTILLFGILNLVQTWQVANGIFPLDGITLEKYNYLFLKTDKKYAGLMGEEAIPSFGKIVEPKLFFIEENFDLEKNIFNHSLILQDKTNLNNRIALVDDNFQFAFTASYKILKQKIFSRLYITLEFDYFDEIILGAKDLVIVFTITDSNSKNLYYYPTMLMDWPNVTSGWHHRKLSNEIKETIQNGNTLSVYFYNPKGNRILIDNYRILVQGLE